MNIHERGGRTQQTFVSMFSASCYLLQKCDNEGEGPPDMQTTIHHQTSTPPYMSNITHAQHHTCATPCKACIASTTSQKCNTVNAQHHNCATSCKRIFIHVQRHKAQHHTCAKSYTCNLMHAQRHTYATSHMRNVMHMPSRTCATSYVRTEKNASKKARNHQQK